ncbi:hypothetical protein [Flavobacterium sp. xlx-214]|nr:hypothetical protein [Flavobacterium sp. xlx-214]
MIFFVCNNGFLKASLTNKHTLQINLYPFLGHDSDITSNVYE